MMITQEGRVLASYALQEAKRYDHDLEPKTFYANILYAPRRLIGPMSYSRLCCDLRLLMLRNEAATSEIIPALSIRSSKLIGNQLGLHAVYMASLYPSEIRRIKLPFALQHNSHRRILKVAHRWLDFAGSHGPVFCREILSSKLGGQSFFCDHVGFLDNVLFCDHVVEELLKFCLVPLLGRSAAFKTTEVMILRKIRRLLRHMPHTITVSRPFLDGALRVTWEDNETESFRKRSMHDPPYHVVLHKEECSSARADLIHGDAGMWSLAPTNRDNATDAKTPQWTVLYTMLPAGALNSL
jgi:hypothetical protein